MISYIVLAIFFGFVCYHFIQKSFDPKGSKPLPSPPGARFFYGHYGLLGDKPQETLTRWARELKSNIYSIRMGRSNYIILNKDEVVGELFQKRGKIYSSRQNSYNFQHILRGVGFSGCPYNDYYKKIKAIINGFFKPEKIEMYSPLINRVTKEVLFEMGHTCTTCSNSNPDPINPRLYIRRITLDVILNIAFGVHTESIDDPLFKRLDKLLNDLTLIFSNVSRELDYFPILKWLPGYRKKKNATVIRDEAESLFGEFLENIKSGKNKNPCIMREMYEKRELKDHEIIHNLLVLVFSGTDTLTSSIMWLLAHLANNPQLQEQSRKELDTLFPNHDQLPTPADSKNLPYIYALIREGQRVYPPSWMGVPHFIEQDDEYDGYHIPADSLVFINIHAISFDETRHKNAKEFDPYRFINVEQSMASLAKGSAEKRDHFSFGGGRRLCPGIHLAEYELFNIVSNILFCFYIKNAFTDEDGKSIPIDLSKNIIGCTFWPVDYDIRLVPRGDWVEKLLK